MRSCTLNKIILVFSCFVFFGCASMNPSMGLVSFGKTNISTQDTIDGKTITETMVIVPLGSSFSKEDDMALLIGRHTKENDQSSYYYFRTEIHSTDWLFAEGINIKIDDNVYRLKDNNPNRQVRSGNYIIEIMSFGISDEMLKELKSCNVFKAELYKRVVTIEGENLQKFKNFLIQ